MFKQRTMAIGSGKEMGSFQPNVCQNYPASTTLPVLLNFLQNQNLYDCMSQFYSAVYLIQYCTLYNILVTSQFSFRSFHKMISQPLNYNNNDRCWSEMMKKNKGVRVWNQNARLFSQLTTGRQQCGRISWLVRYLSWTLALPVSSVPASQFRG